MRYLGIDYGTQRVGIALSDESGRMGFPHSILQQSPHLAADIVLLIKEQKVGAVVIGESKDFAGVDNAIAPAARALGAQLTEEAGVPVYFQNETMTSAEARRAPEKQEKTRKPASHAAIDASAAALILTSYLSRTTHG